MKRIKSASVRLEGDVNQYYTLTYDDGSWLAIEAPEGSIRVLDGTDQTIINKDADLLDPHIYWMLQMLQADASDSAPSDFNWNSDTLIVEYNAFLQIIQSVIERA
jgi:hypothetical protein